MRGWRADSCRQQLSEVRTICILLYSLLHLRGNSTCQQSVFCKKNKSKLKVNTLEYFRYYCNEDNITPFCGCVELYLCYCISHIQYLYLRFNVLFTVTIIMFIIEYKFKQHAFNLFLSTALWSGNRILNLCFNMDLFFLKMQLSELPWFSLG